MKKRLILLCLTALTCVLLTSCGGEGMLSGELIERNFEDGRLVSIVIREDSGGELFGIVITEQTRMVSWSWMGGTAQQLLTDEQPQRMKLSIRHNGGEKRMTAQRGRQIRAFEAETLEISDIMEKAAMTLSDGTPADVWRGSGREIYCLPDGTKLLIELSSTGPDNSYVAGQPGLDALNERAQSNIKAFYERRGLLYSINEEIERAYSVYKSSEEFNAHAIEQAIVPVAASERAMYFLTSVMLPNNDGIGIELRLGDAFDRETGDHIEQWELFDCGKEEALDKILELSKINDHALEKELRDAIRPEYLIFFPENLELSFPQGSLPSQRYPFGLGLDYDDGLEEIMHQWAIPEDDGRRRGGAGI